MKSDGGSNCVGEQGAKNTALRGKTDGRVIRTTRLDRFHEDHLGVVARPK